MSEIPPQQFAEYPRENPYGSADKLQALADGYYGLNWIFMVAIWGYFGSSLLSIALKSQAAFLIYFVILIGLIIWCWKLVRLSGEAMPWGSGKVLTANILMTLNFFTCGIIGFIVYQTILSREIKKYGIRQKFFGIQKKDVKDKVAALRAKSEMMPTFVSAPRLSPSSDEPLA